MLLGPKGTEDIGSQAAKRQSALASHLGKTRLSSEVVWEPLGHISKENNPTVSPPGLTLLQTSHSRIQPNWARPR